MIIESLKVLIEVGKALIDPSKVLIEINNKPQKIKAVGITGIVSDKQIRN